MIAICCYSARGCQCACAIARVRHWSVPFYVVCVPTVLQRHIQTQLCWAQSLLTIMLNSPLIQWWYIVTWKGRSKVLQHFNDIFICWQKQWQWCTTKNSILRWNRVLRVLCKIIFVQTQSILIHKHTPT